MKHTIALLIIGLFSGLTALAQGTVYFDIDFGANPPPHTSGNPVSGASLLNNSFYAILYLDTTTPISGSIGEMVDGTFTSIFQFTNLVYATYSGGGPALDYEGSWQLTDSQAQNLMAGQWYADVTYSDGSYIGQINAVPEPSSSTLLLIGLLAVPIGYRRMLAKAGMQKQC